MSTSAAPLASTVLMIEPLVFMSNPQTGTDNFFQRRAEAAEVSRQALAEWEHLKSALEQAGVQVMAFSNESPATPDALYPNNWFSTHPGGRLCLYPMKAPNRRLERRPEIIAFLRSLYPTVLDITGHEREDRFLEGTGSIVIDHTGAIAYAAVSARTDATLFQYWAACMGYKPFIFSAEDDLGRPIYHTNVCLSVSSYLSFWVPDAIPDARKRKSLEQRLSGYPLITLSIEQMEKFCANVLVVQGSEMRPVLVCSTGAWGAYSPEQQVEIARHVLPVHVPLETIETCGGGGARCMVAELWA